MSSIIVSSSNTAQWQELVQDAENASQINLGEELESYLVFLLMRYMEKPELLGRIMALEFLGSMESSGQLKQDLLRDVGDSCLLFSGFFPKIAEKRRVSISYYVGIGKSAYYHLAESCQYTMNALYQQLVDGFVRLMDVLQAIRSFDQATLLSPLEAFELWHTTGSRQAYAAIHSQNAIPVHKLSKRKH